MGVVKGFNFTLHNIGSAGDEEIYTLAMLDPSTDVREVVVFPVTLTSSHLMELLDIITIELNEEPI